MPPLHCTQLPDEDKYIKHLGDAWFMISTATCNRCEEPSRTCQLDHGTIVESHQSKKTTVISDCLLIELLIEQSLDNDNEIYLWLFVTFTLSVTLYTRGALR
jgi:hypothetical protein